MLKWIASGCLVIIVVVCVVMYAGYRKMQSLAADGPSVTVGFAAPPDRVFASMSHTDSLPVWFAIGSTIQTTRKGPLAIGDTLYVLTRRDSIPRIAWVVDTVLPTRVIAMHWVSLPNSMVVWRRRDSVYAAGDSTFVTSTFSSLMTDSLAAARSRSKGVTGGMLEMGANMGIAAARIQAENDLRRLKLHLEGPPASRP